MSGSLEWGLDTRPERTDTEGMNLTPSQEMSYHAMQKMSRESLLALSLATATQPATSHERPASAPEPATGILDWSVEYAAPEFPPGYGS
jgi:hypothetical protein